MTKKKAVKALLPKNFSSVEQFERMNEEVALLRKTTRDLAGRLAKAEKELEDRAVKNLSNAIEEASGTDRLVAHNERMKAFIKECLRIGTFNSTKAGEVLKP